MPRRSAQTNEAMDTENIIHLPNNEQNNDEVGNLSRMLAAVLDYLSDEEVDEIDVQYILEKTEGLREWWNLYRESNRKLIEEEIRESLGELSLEELQRIREQIKEKQD
ncbi:hypothetical protein RRV45_10210 [Bacillus sp. DTU_2020_1000418_1_SI_GHA_SEK_038]|uniref:hypothetical protein n=1 Tax=Bacillus sp. DTU_2020_1000418_1_SI_GHA_SEK_038 TaxID=3077585 RepID=UPI0028F0DCB2|nr:hypothetical protein [Bacillus sp. DTU_2020_1000418_1_SI_GHA_SEK_038]WNS77332.1 hypothetical protein RRV45_10210 [Bacillus sp. DTU_2020_1000418_1_SI_GHA_SEK_038]